MPGALRILLCAVLAALAVAAPRTAAAFCGFYAGHADAALVNRATTVVLMRIGTRTVLSMRNDYVGPPEDFALVVPVPVVLHRGDVRVLPHAIFDQLDLLTAPRLVEYWEADPCADRWYTRDSGGMTSPSFGSVSTTIVWEGGGRNGVVQVKARFEVGEYDVVVLGARDSLGLEQWLQAHGYAIPAGSAAALRPYVQAGMKFVVAKVAIDRVRRTADGRATLSPLRFHYDSDTFSLPIRLGLLNADGPQDLLVHVIADRRYQASNRVNLAIPTNLDVFPVTRDAFSQFYAALFDRTVAAAPGAVVTEYAWESWGADVGAKCDPCPAPPLDEATMLSLGGDVLWKPLTGSIPREVEQNPTTAPLPAQPDEPHLAQPVGRRVGLEVGEGRTRVDGPREPRRLVFTRLHMRYGAADLGEDLVLQAAPAITGGREQGPPLPHGPRVDDGPNQFQARYAIRHAWAGEIACAEPQRGHWGGPPDSKLRREPSVAIDTAFVARDAPLSRFLVGEAGPAEVLVPALSESPAGGCARCETGPGGLLALLLLLRRRRRR